MKFYNLGHKTFETDFNNVTCTTITVKGLNVVR